MTIPDPWPGLVLALAAFRLTRLVGWDDLTIRPRRWLTGIGDKQHHQWAEWIDLMQEKGLDPFDPRTEAGMKVPPISEQRFYLSRLVRCGWCAGFWLSLGLSASWWASPHWTLLGALPFALSAVVGLAARWLDP